MCLSLVSKKRKMRWGLMKFHLCGRQFELSFLLPAMKSLLDDTCASQVPGTVLRQRTRQLNATTVPLPAEWEDTGKEGNRTDRMGTQNRATRIRRGDTQDTQHGVTEPHLQGCRG